MSVRTVEREVEVSHRVWVEMEVAHIRSLILGSLQLDPSALPEPSALTTADIKSAVAIMRTAERLRGIASERAVERAFIETELDRKP